MTDAEGETEVTWPLFVACEKGQLSMVKLLLKHIIKPYDDKGTVDENSEIYKIVTSKINMQNNKGTTCLWIAVCNNHIDVASELLNFRADPNIPNFKGDSPLIPCCQKGLDTMAEFLLQYGAGIDVYNKERDNPVLICCRNGQHKILDMLLKKYDTFILKLILETYAEIDGFAPLLASTELDKIECIKVCVAYGADLELKTQPDNKVISGATALHLACFYGRLLSAKTLLSFGANILSQTSEGSTPLHIAIKQGHLQVVRLLLNLQDGKKALEIQDLYGRIPAYYANIVGNEAILEEFFTNKLALYLENALLSELEVEKGCADILVKYGRSLGCYEYSEITNIDLYKGMSPLSVAIINGNDSMMNNMIKMGANLYKPDDYGVTPDFWNCYLNHTLSSNNDTIKMLETVNKVSKLSIQNKSLLSLSNKNILMLDDKNQLGTLVKMSDGYNMKIHKKVLTDLRNSRKSDHSLLGFIDKFNKVITKEKKFLDFLIWDAKIHTIKVIASQSQGVSSTAGLQPIHIMAIYLYTSNSDIFTQVNKALVSKSFYDVGSKSNLLQQFIYTLYQGITLLPNYEGEAYRAVSINFDREQYAVGSKIKWDTFSICSSLWKNAGELINTKRGIIFIIKSKTGRDISKYSKYPVDNEIVFLPESEFIVTNHYIASVIALGQANIRNITFKSMEKDLIKASNGEVSIIVEIEEI